MSNKIHLHIFDNLKLLNKLNIEACYIVDIKTEMELFEKGKSGYMRALYNLLKKLQKLILKNSHWCIKNNLKKQHIFYSSSNKTGIGLTEDICHQDRLHSKFRLNQVEVHLSKSHRFVCLSMLSKQSCTECKFLQKIDKSMKFGIDYNFHLIINMQGSIDYSLKMSQNCSLSSWIKLSCKECTNSNYSLLIKVHGWSLKDKVHIHNQKHNFHLV